ncbi:MAG: AAA family ATPase [Succinivibrio sp.]
MENYVITISRQFGSLGRPIAQKLAHRLNIEYYDRDLIEKAASILNEDMRSISPYDESISLPFAKALFPLGIGTGSTHRRLFKVQENLISECVQKSNCIIVGRCADFILKDYPRRFNVMIYAPLEERIKNAVNELRIPEYEVEDYVKEIDKARDSYHKFFTDEKLDTTKYRDLLIDSSTMSQNDVVEVIIDAARRKLNF